ncbi:hypothetical protein [Actinoallomurus iriomotensis]|uniref:Secreted protein n=1 Tax=Actinoallomurus iriomotensis TaxID=478107 RepID=A0A9W6VXS8_9ACTN|nr:hypothetical protein [Actinoallomurus iriomotensis]GLY83574.1 hypothetical protein Airi02_015040 [Actinoallomurus iriomotensis]
MLKKTCVTSGLLIVTAAGAILTSVPAFAQTPTWGGGGCCSGSSSRFGNFTRNRSWNGNENEGFNHIRLRLHNRNNNIAVARTPERRDDRPLVLNDEDRRR